MEKQKHTNDGPQVSEFEAKKITPLFWKYSLLALAGLAAQSVSVVTDGFFVGAGVGVMGTATIGIVAPLWSISLALFGLYGMGAGVISATKLGQGDEEGARKAYGTTLSFSFLLCAVIAIICIIGAEPLLRLLGATDEIMPYAKDYLIPYMIGVPACMAANVALQAARVDEKPKAASIAAIGPALVGILLEWFLVIKLGWGMKGAAIFWVASVGLGVLVIPYMQVTSKKMKLKWSDLKIDFKVVGAATKIGFPIFVMPMCTSIAGIVVNRMIVACGGSELEIAAFAIMNAYIMFNVTMIITAFITGMQPIASFNKGAGHLKRVAELIKVATVQSTVALIGVTIVIFIFAQPIVSFFVSSGNMVVIETTVRVMKMYMVLFAFGGVSQITSGYFMTVRRTGLAIFNGISRLLIFAIPLMIILPKFMGLNGIFIAQPIADLLSAIIAAIIIYREYKKLNAEAETL